MRRLLSCLGPAGCLLILALPAASQARPPLALQEVLDPEVTGRQVADFAWSPDGSRLAYVWEDELWLLDPVSARLESLLRTGEELDSFAWSPQGDALLLVTGGDLYLQPAAGGPPRRLTQTEAEEEDPKLSPDGTRVAFVRNLDLYLLDLATGRERALTSDGREGVTINGATDWVYWEEIWGRESTGHWWSPDSRRIAYYRFDETLINTHPLVDEADPAQPPRVNRQKYPRPGENNPKVKVGVLDLDSGRTTWMATGEEDSYLARVDWTPDGRAVAIQRLNRDQTRLDLLRCSAAAAEDGGCSPLLTETWKTWVNLGDDFRFLDDGRFLWGSERDGWRRLYLYGADGGLLRTVTPEGWAVTSLDAVSERDVVFTGFRTSGLGAAERHVVRTRLTPPANADFEVLTTEPGWHEATVAPRTGLWVHRWSDAETPPRVVGRRADGREAASLPWESPAFDPKTLPRWELTTIPGPEGSSLPARLLKPQGFDPARRYPVIVYHYGGPASQVVVNRWDARGRDLWHKAMAQHGFAVAMVDNQSSLFFGRAGEDRDHRLMGPGNLAAQLALVDYLKGLGWADTERLGLWGWSGGGFNTLYCLLHSPGVWKAGMAGAPVTDWRLYDSIWTERYLDTPQDNPEGYRASSPFHDAEKLRDRLLIVHGLADDNVHPQNTVAMSDRLIEAGLPFEQAFYPGQKHAMGSTAMTHFYGRMAEFFERTLRGEVVVEDVEVRAP